MHFLNLNTLLRLVIVCALIWVFMPAPAYARVVSNVQVRQLSDGYQIDLEFLFPIRYLSHSPTSMGKELRVLLRPSNFQQLTQQQVDDLRDRITLSWDATSGVPLEEIALEGGDPERPLLTMYFSREVEFAEVRSSDNLQSLIIKIKSEVITPSYYRMALSEIKPPPPFELDDITLRNKLEEVYRLSGENKYIQAIALLRALGPKAAGKDRQHLIELLGFLLELNGQLPRAKQVYTQYLKEFAGDPDAAWVRHRMDVIKWAEDGIRMEEAEARKHDKWKSNVYGTVSEFFYRDQTTPKGRATSVNRNEFVTSLDLNHRVRNSRFDVRSQISGSFTDTLFSREGETGDISNFSIEGKDEKSTWFGKLGRQFRASGGTLDIFDGAHVSRELNDKIKANVVFGFPVNDTSVKEVDGDRTFYGTSFDFGKFNDQFDFTAYFLTQDNHGYVDRRAVGLEARFYQSNRSLTAVMDYDVFYNHINIFYANGWWSLRPGTSLNLSYDYRYNPSLATENALLGQTETELPDLAARFSKGDLFDLARDRSSAGRSISASITQDLKKDVQVSTGLTAYEAEGTVTSGGVIGTDSTGYDMFYFTQLITYNLIKKNDIVITSFNFDDTAYYYNYSVSLSDQFPLTGRIKLTPLITYGFRDYKDNDNSRNSLRPGFRFDYRIKKWLRFETELGAEWVREDVSGNASSSFNLIFSAGFTVTF